jgi:hypothetical protein
MHIAQVLRCTAFRRTHQLAPSCRTSSQACTGSTLDKKAVQVRSTHLTLQSRNPVAANAASDLVTVTSDGFSAVADISLEAVCQGAATGVIVAACVRNVPQLYTCWKHKRCDA